MQIDAQDFLRLCEDAKTLCFFDTEATGLRGDYNSTLVISCKLYGMSPVSFTIQAPGNDKRVVREARDFLSEQDCIVTYYGKGYDVPFLNTRLLRWGYEPLDPIHHVDLYFQGKAHLLTARRSQGHLLSWLETPEEKMTVGADVWNQIVNPETFNSAMRKMVKRCESDVTGLEQLYERLKHLIRDIKKK